MKRQYTIRKKEFGNIRGMVLYRVAWLVKQDLFDVLGYDGELSSICFPNDRWEVERELWRKGEGRWVYTLVRKEAVCYILGAIKRTRDNYKAFEWVGSKVVPYMDWLEMRYTNNSMAEDSYRSIKLMEKDAIKDFDKKGYERKPKSVISDYLINIEGSFGSDSFTI